MGLLGLGSLTFTVKGTYAQIGTLQLALSVGRTCVLVRTIIEQGMAKPPRGNDDGQPTGSQMENCREVPSSTGVWRHVRSPRPQSERPANLIGGPRWTLVEEYGGRTKRFQGALRREQFLEIGVGAL